jgi:SAM-dependent methyltransferase
MTAPLEPAATQDGRYHPLHEPLARTHGNCLTRLRLDLRWDSAAARHLDSSVVSRLDLRRDILPPALEALIVDQPVGHRTSHTFTPGALVEPARDADRPMLRAAQFNRGFTGRAPIQPRVGRFYPKGILTGVPGIVSAERTPFRVLDSDAETLHLDLAHPLADKTLHLALTIEAAWTGPEQRGDRCTDLARLLTANGPGMQGRAGDRPTDFWSDRPFTRSDPSPDAAFYARPRYVDHIDSTAIAEISALYGRLIPAPDAAAAPRVLDLMASWHSHLPASLDAAHVTGLGMNQAELDANPALAERIVHDLNREPKLPFADAAFDAVICTVSVEYLIEPFVVFRDIARVLRPGGRIAVTFSNRWFPPKAIAVWAGLHEFERPGLVLEYLLESGRFTDLNTWSLRGLPRPADDAYADRLRLSDPVHAVWATRAADGG